MKNKTLATWLTFIAGPLGLHRFYLHGLADWLGWLLPIPTALGFYGIERARLYGLDDQLSWLLIPCLGFTFAACALRAILYGLTPCERWNARYNPQAAADAPAGRTHWLAVIAMAMAMTIGTGALMASIAFSSQRFFEYQIEEARKISQPQQ